MGIEGTWVRGDRAGTLELGEGSATEGSMVERVVGHSLETMYIYRDTADMGFLVDPGWGAVQEAWREGWGCFGSPPYRQRGWCRVAIDYGELARQIKFQFFVHFHA
jgi:hypothetical protein